MFSFQRVRRRVAWNLQNPRINAITFTTFRHWGATVTYALTKDILLVQKILGHKQITSTMKYTQLVQFKHDEFHVATATTVEEAKELLATGFDYITEKSGIMLFRKPKIKAIG
jgi:integrase